MKVWIGIDPGNSGALAVLTECGEAWAYNFSDAAIGMIIRSEIERLRSDGYLVFANLESVHAFPGQGVSSCFSFGCAFGEAKGALDALQVPYRLITPQSWQKGILGLPKKKDGAIAHKTALKQEAQRRFPQCKPTLKTADALLIADYCRQTNK